MDDPRAGRTVPGHVEPAWVVDDEGLRVGELDDEASGHAPADGRVIALHA
jgi:hypothetical protein